MKKRSQVGVVLSGGGAKGAYQAGVLRAVYEITNGMGIKNPFPIISGISVGSINSSYLAAHAHDLEEATSRLVSLWNSVHSKQIIKTDTFSIMKIAFRWLFEMTAGGFVENKKARALLDNSPLVDFVEKEINFARIQKNIDEGFLDGIVITAVNYSNGCRYNFYQCHDEILPWTRVKRIAVHTRIEKEHVLASSAIPLYFPPQKIGSSYYADGNLRNNTPLSPSLRLGAEKLLIIPVRKQTTPGEEHKTFDPTLGRIISVILDSLLLDAIDFDIERLTRINETLRHVDDPSSTELCHIDTCIIRPSVDLAEIAVEEVKALPRSIRYLISGTGSKEDTKGIISVLLFESHYTQRLTRLGYDDAMNQKEEIAEFYSQ